jgi:hypothetical protein
MEFCFDIPRAIGGELGEIESSEGVSVAALIGSHIGSGRNSMSSKCPTPTRRE